MRAVDLFAGFGGTTVGATQAGARVVWAGNHWPLAVQVHADNHPDAVHACQDLRQADWGALPRYDLLLASPACQGHSMASQPNRRTKHEGDRATAWAVVDCADVTEPRAIVVENVPTFLQWRLFPEWRAALERMGYRLQVRTVMASRLGVPQRRERLFIVGTRGRLTVDLALPETEEPAFGACVDWSAPGWRPVARARAGARARIARGRSRLGSRFLTQHVTNHPGVPLTEPIRTLTTKDQWALVDGERYRPLTLREVARGMGFPESYRWPSTATRKQVIAGLGNAVPPPVARALVGRILEAA